MRHKSAQMMVTAVVLMFTLCLIGCGKENDIGDKSVKQKIVEGSITDIYNDPTAGEAFVTIQTREGLFILDCKKKGFDVSISNGDTVKVSVDNIRVTNGSNIGDLKSVISHKK